MPAGREKDGKEEMTMTREPAGHDSENAAQGATALHRQASGIPVTDVEVEEADGITEFTGQLIAEISTRTGRQGRWTELRLYWHGDGGYVLVKTGKSVIYHVHGGQCNTGLPAAVGDLFERLSDEEFEGLIRCHVCRPRPMSELDDDDMISVETDRNGLTIAETTPALLEQLQWQSYHNQGSADQPYSAPAERLLRIAAEKDPEIQRLIRKKRRI